DARRGRAAQQASELDERKGRHERQSAELAKLPPKTRDRDLVRQLEAEGKAIEEAAQAVDEEQAQLGRAVDQVGQQISMARAIRDTQIICDDLGLGVHNAVVPRAPRALIQQAALSRREQFLREAPEAQQAERARKAVLATEAELAKAALELEE